MGFSTGFYPVYEVYWDPCRADGRTYVRTYGHVTITSLPKFLGLIGYQISLAMEESWGFQRIFGNFRQFHIISTSVK